MCAISFPTSLDSLTNNTDNVDTIVAQDINDLNDAVEALEAKVGVDSSAVSTSLDYKIRNSTWPVGSVFISVLATSPNTLLGFGTWARLAEGKFLISQTDSDADFNVARDAGGAKTATIAAANLPNISVGAGTAHTHIQTAHTHIQDAHTHTIQSRNVDGTGVYGREASGTGGNINVDAATATNQNTTPTNQNESTHTHSLGGSGTALGIMNPFYTVYMWERTA
jgi:hypothetical protein